MRKIRGSTNRDEQMRGFGEVGGKRRDVNKIGDGDRGKIGDGNKIGDGERRLGENRR